MKIINYECPHYVTHCSYRRFRGSPRLNWVLVPFSVWVLKWKRHQPMALSLGQRSFISIKSQIEWWLGTATSLSLNAGWTHRQQHCIFQPPSVSSIMFIFIPFHSFLYSCPFSCIVTYSYIQIFIESILFMCLEVLIVNFHIFAFSFYFLHSFQNLFMSPFILLSVAHIFTHLTSM